MLFSFVRNVEQASSTTPPDAFASRPFVLNDAVLTGHSQNTDDLTAGRHISQTLITAEGMSPWRKATALAVTNAIGNSLCPPFLNPSLVYRAQSGGGTGTANKSACDYSWMANTALWDSWILSGIVDGSGTGSSQWQKDSRSPRSQFQDLSTGKGLLRNKRFLFYPYSVPKSRSARTLSSSALMVRRGTPATARFWRKPGARR